MGRKEDRGYEGMRDKGDRRNKSSMRDEYIRNKIREIWDIRMRDKGDGKGIKGDWSDKIKNKGR
jgi:hypothetical protein